MPRTKKLKIMQKIDEKISFAESRASREISKRKDEIGCSDKAFEYKKQNYYFRSIVMKRDKDSINGGQL